MTIKERERIYVDLKRKRKDGTDYATLRVSTTPDFSGTRKIHIREWTHTSRDPFLLVPTRGIALTYEELDAVIYALALVREDAKKRVNDDAATHSDDPEAGHR